MQGLTSVLEGRFVEVSGVAWDTWPCPLEGYTAAVGVGRRRCDC